MEELEKMGYGGLEKISGSRTLWINAKCKDF